MPRPYQIIWKYQSDEEILQSAIWYFDPGSAPVLTPETLSDLSAGVATRIASNFPEVFALDVVSWSVTVAAPVTTLSGPARFINTQSEEFGDGPFPKSMDSLLANVTLRGTNAADETVTGGMRLSGLDRGSFDKTQLEASKRASLEDALIVVFPPVINVTGLNLERCIRSVRPPADVEYVFPTTLEVSSRAGVRIDRVGNRPQRNTGPVVP